MERTGKVSNTQLERMRGNPQAKDELLYRGFGLTADRLSGLREGNVFERIKNAALLLDCNGFGDKITLLNLAALIDGHWDVPSRYVRLINDILVDKYGDSKKSMTMTHGWDVPWTHFFRTDIGIYRGNLEQAHQTWKNIVPSDLDWQRSLTIPLSIDAKVALLLGFYWGNLVIGRGAFAHGQMNS